MPVSHMGWYMVSTEKAMRCHINLPKKKSVCKGGYPYTQRDQSCVEGHTGPLCASCEAGYVRDTAYSPCMSCKSFGASWLLVLILIAETVIYAAWSLFISKRALDAVHSNKKLDTVLLRILMNFAMVSSSLRYLKVENINVFSWDETRILADQAAQKASASGAGSIRTTTTIRFPQWFNDTWNSLFWWRGSIPHISSISEKIQCLMMRFMDGDAQKQYIAQMVFWLLCPLIVCFWVVVLAIIIAKIWHAKLKLTCRSDSSRAQLLQKLIEVGVTKVTAETLAGTVGSRCISEFVTMGHLPSLKRLAEYGGIDAVCEILAESLMAADVTSLPESVRKTWRSGDRPLVRKLKLAKLLKNKLDLEILNGFASDMVSWKQQAVEELVRPSENDDKNTMLQGHLTQARSQQLPWTVSYPVLGLFRGANISTVVRDAAPALLITMYTMWELVTREFLLGMNSQTVPQRLGRYRGIDTVQSGIVWKYRTSYDFFGEEHLPIALLAIIGLCFWSLGLPLGIFWLCRMKRSALNSFATRRLLGFFCNGLEPSYYWWELLVKRFDVLVMYTIAFSGWLQEEKAQVIASFGSTALFWVCHCTALPFDNRRVKLADRSEEMVLWVRYITMLSLLIVLLCDTTYYQNIVVALMVVLLNGAMILWLLVCILCDICGTWDDTSQTALAQASPEFWMSKAIRRVENLRAGLVIIFMSPFRRLEFERQKQQGAAPVLVWSGKSQPLKLISPDKGLDGFSFRCLHRFSFHPVAKVCKILYRTDDESQKEHIAVTLCEILQQVLLEGLTAWPSELLDILLVIPHAIRQIRQEDQAGMILPEAHDVAAQIRQIFLEAGGDKQLVAVHGKDVAASGKDGASKVTTECESCDPRKRFKIYADAEDLAFALYYIQSMPSGSWAELLTSVMNPERSMMATGTSQRRKQVLLRPQIEKRLRELRQGALKLNNKIHELEKRNLELREQSEQLNFKVLELEAALKLEAAMALQSTMT